jgi:hypothetical protein
MLKAPPGPSSMHPSEGDNRSERLTDGE